MYRIALINMPFAKLPLPSIALTQLKAVVESQFKEQVSINLLYLNHDFANYLGLDLYHLIVNSTESQNSGLGDGSFDRLPFRTYLTTPVSTSRGTFRFTQIK
jgi:hypothetical protein